MPDKTYKLTATLSTGEEIDCGTFTAPQGPRGSTIIGHYTASYIPLVTDEEYLSFESLSGVPAVGDTIIVVWSATNGNSALVTAEVIDINPTGGVTGEGEITIIVNSVTNTRGATGAMGPQGPRGATGPAGATKYLHKIQVKGAFAGSSFNLFFSILNTSSTPITTWTALTNAMRGQGYFPASGNQGSRTIVSVMFTGSNLSGNTVYSQSTSLQGYTAMEDDIDGIVDNVD